MTDDSDASHSARIGITVSDIDPDRAFGLARDLAAIVIETAAEQRADQTKKLAADIAAMRERLEQRLGDIAGDDRSRRSTRRKMPVRLGTRTRAEALDLELAQLRQEQKTANHTLGTIADSRDAAADQIAAAGLDVSVDIVDEHKPRESDHRSFVLAMVIVVIAFGAALGSALILGAFDARVHDTDDVERLGLTVLGHLPGFPGDQVGSLRRAWRLAASCTIVHEMALAPITPRDRLQRLVDLGRKTLGYWWLIARSRSSAARCR